MIPNNLLQHPMSGKPTWLPGYIPNKMPKGRPIISDCNSVSEKVAEYIDNHLKFKASQHPSYIKKTRMISLTR